MKYFDTNIYDAVQKLSQEFFFGMFNMRCQQFDSKLSLIESYCSFRQNSFLRKFVHSFEVNIFFRRWSFFAFACFFNLLFSCARLLHSFFTLRYLRVYFLCVVFPFWCQPCKFSGKVFKCFTSISFILVSFKFFSSVWSFAKRAVNIDVKIKSDEAENIATFLCWLRDDVHIHLATLIGQQSRALLT